MDKRLIAFLLAILILNMTLSIQFSCHDTLEWFKLMFDTIHP